MIEVLFKSEELLIAADSESKVEVTVTPLEALREWDIL